MATTTPNYGLNLPGENDFYNVEDFNENFNKVDQELKRNADAVANIDLSGITPESIGAATKSEFDAHAADNSKHVTAAKQASWDAKETPAGAQAKANQAETNAKNASAVSKTVGDLNNPIDVNTLITPGIYNVINGINTPDRNKFYGMFVSNAPNQNWVQQLVFEHDTRNVWYRNSYDGGGRVWQPWIKVITSEGGNISGDISFEQSKKKMYMYRRTSDHLYSGLGQDMDGTYNLSAFFPLNNGNGSFSIGSMSHDGNMTYKPIVAVRGNGEMWVSGRNILAEIDSVKQSGVDAKAAVVASINAMGGSATTNDTWATLAAKIRQIQTGKKFAKGTATADASNKLTVTGIGFKPKTVYLNAYYFPAEQFHWLFYSEESNSVSNDAWVTQYGGGSNVSGTNYLSDQVTTNSNGFVATNANSSNKNYSWYAWE